MTFDLIFSFGINKLSVKLQEVAAFAAITLCAMAAKHCLVRLFTAFLSAEQREVKTDNACVHFAVLLRHVVKCTVL